MNSRRFMCPLRTHMVQGLKPSTVRLGGERETAHNQPSGQMSAFDPKQTWAWPAAAVGTMTVLTFGAASEVARVHSASRWRRCGRSRYERSKPHFT